MTAFFVVFFLFMLLLVLGNDFSTVKISQTNLTSSYVAIRFQLCNTLLSAANDSSLKSVPIDEIKYINSALESAICNFTFSFDEFGRNYSEKSDIPWLNLHNQSSKKLSTSPFRIVFLGDSIVAEMNVNFVPGRKKNMNHRFVLQKHFGSTVIAAGIHSDTTQNLWWRLQHGETPKYAPAVIFLLIGINDLFSRKVVEAFTGIIAIVVHLLAAFESTKVVVMTALPIFLRKGRYQFQRGQLNSHLLSFSSLMQNSIPRMDFLHCSCVFAKNRQLFHDAKHPNQIGYEVLFSGCIEPFLFTHNISLDERSTKMSSSLSSSGSSGSGSEKSLRSCPDTAGGWGQMHLHVKQGSKKRNK